MYVLDKWCYRTYVSDIISVNSVKTEMDFLDLEVLILATSDWKGQSYCTILYMLPYSTTFSN